MKAFDIDTEWAVVIQNFDGVSDYPTKIIGPYEDAGKADEESYKHNNAVVVEIIPPPYGVIE